MPHEVCQLSLYTLCVACTWIEAPIHMVREADPCVCDDQQAHVGTHTGRDSYAQFMAHVHIVLDVYLCVCVN